MKSSKSDLEAAPPLTAVQECVREYRRYLVLRRGLSVASLPNYLSYVEQFLQEKFAEPELRFDVLRAPDVMAFVKSHVAKLAPGRAKLLVTALRSFLRYLLHQVKITVDLSPCVLPVACWSYSEIPKSLPPGVVEQLLAQYNRKTPIGRRNYAILLLLARFGLRAGEVVTLNLEDLDWDSGLIRIRRKGRRWTQLPLPADVGAAIAAYLRSDRPPSSSRRVFLCHCAPARGFAGTISISSIVRRTLIRAGVDSARTGAHVLRHTLAVELLRNGASLDEIGDVLGHPQPEHNSDLCQGGPRGAPIYSASLARGRSMKNLRRGAEDYLADWVSSFKRHGRFVREFISWLESCGEHRITTRLALQWATQPQNLQPAEWAARLSAVRGFARYWNAIDGTSEIPAEGLLPFRTCRRAPYLYSSTEIQQLLEAAKSMPAQFKLQPLTYYCLLGLLTVTGLRISEALNFESRDVDWTESLLTIRTSKFGKSRFVPLDRTTKGVLAEYAARRNHIFPDRRPAAALTFRHNRPDQRAGNVRIAEIHPEWSSQSGMGELLPARLSRNRRLSSNTSAGTAKRYLEVCRLPFPTPQPRSHFAGAPLSCLRW